MVFIKEYVNELLDDGTAGIEVANVLGVSVSMVSSYKLHEYNPSLDVAKRVYTSQHIILHPFAEESLIHEIEKDKR